ncbi:MAG TPA: alpha/beta fold hydrolase [Planctomycetia bacterium]|nr:alpha/beta fold hydrolase [Planctomycetia bacterium]
MNRPSIPIEKAVRSTFSIAARGLVAVALALSAAGAAIAQEDAKPTKRKIRAADGLELVCETRGKGETTLVFLHGWCGDRDYWKNQVDEFAADYRIVALDQAGHGESGKSRAKWTIAGLAEDVEATVKALGIKRGILVGHSMSGPIALAAARRMPGTVVAVIGADTLQNVEAKPPEEFAKQIRDGFAADFKGFMTSGFEGLLGAKVDPEVKKRLLARSLANDPKMAVPLMADLQGLDQKTLLKEAKVPVRCINSGGGFQFFTPTDVAVNRKYADYDAALIPDVGHYPMLEKPAEFNAKLRETLKGLGAKK